MIIRDRSTRGRGGALVAWQFRSVRLAIHYSSIFLLCEDEKKEKEKIDRLYVYYVYICLMLKSMCNGKREKYRVCT